MSNNKNKPSEEALNLIELINLLINRRKLIFLVTSLFIILGITYSILIPNTYRSSATFYPHYENNQPNGIRSLAGLAGINLESEVSSDIPTSLYPKLIKSTSFKSKILNEEVSFENNKMSYRDYLLTKKSNSNFDLKKVIFYPYNLLKKTIFGKKDNLSNSMSNELIVISEEDNELFKILDKNIQIVVNQKDGFIELSAYDTNPIISSIIAKKSNKIFQESIIDFRLKNINEIYKFTINQLEIAKKNLYNIQDSLANFKDSNKSIKSDIFLNKLSRLETEYNISRNVYNELAITKEKTAIEVKKNTPIFTIINNVVVPNEKNSPKRTIITISFTIIGFLLICLWILSENSIREILNRLK